MTNELRCASATQCGALGLCGCVRFFGFGSGQFCVLLCSWMWAAVRGPCVRSYIDPLQKLDSIPLGNPICV